MDRISARQIADILVTAPVWARLGLAIRDARMRERAADCLAATIVDRLSEVPAADPNQLSLL